MFAFWLGREFKLSLSELWFVFPKASFEYISKEIAILGGISESDILVNASRLGGTIKIMELFPDYNGNPSEFILSIAQQFEGKFQYGLSSIGEKKDLKKILINTKNLLKKHNISSRFINKNFQSLSSAQIIGEKLVQRQTDFSILSAEEYEYFGKTIWVQDIENYSKRDYGKTRDMQVGMLPPKLAQMMLNIGGSKKVYDPFCGLGTVLIESIIAGNSEVFGSDISSENVGKTQENIKYVSESFRNNYKNSKVIVLDAKGISSSPLLKESDGIVTEGYLGEIFQKITISEEKIKIEREKLLDIYTHFFDGLKRANYKGNIVISFPFWEIRGKYYYFSEIYDVLEKYCIKEHLLPFHETIKHTRSGSLLYKRDTQIVGREIFKLKIK